MSGNQLNRMPRGVRQQLARRPRQVQENCAAVYALLDDRQGPVTVEKIRKELNLTPGSFKKAIQELLKTTSGLYVTQNGYVLQQHATEDERYWHIGWSLGLFQVAGEHLVLDTDLLKLTPRAITKLVREGKLRDPGRLQQLQMKARERQAVLQKVVHMYREVDRILGSATRKPIKSKDWKKGLKQVKDGLES